MSEEIEINKDNYPNIEKYLKNLAKQKKRFYNRLIEINKQLAEWRKIYEKISKEWFYLFTNYHDIYPEFDETYSVWIDKNNRIFTKFYRDVGKIASLLTNAECKFLLVAATLEMDWKGKLIFDKKTKINLMVYMGYKKINSVEKILTSLCKKDLLKKIRQGEYVFNDLFFSKQPEPSIQLHKDFINKKRKELQKKLPPEISDQIESYYDTTTYHRKPRPDVNPQYQV